MSSYEPNPYAAPQTYSAEISELNIDPAALNKVNAIIKDSDQFWLAILVCLLCTGWGTLIIGPWYIVRLVQWNSVAKRYPILLDRQVPHGSVAQKFQSAKSKLIIAVSIGGGLLLLVVLGFAMLSTFG